MVQKLNDGSNLVKCTEAEEYSTTPGDSSVYFLEHSRRTSGPLRCPLQEISTISSTGSWSSSHSTETEPERAQSLLSYDLISPKTLSTFAATQNAQNLRVTIDET